MCSRASGDFVRPTRAANVSRRRRYYGFQVKLVFDETTGLSDIEIYDCNNGETVVESENGGLEQRLSSGAGASGDCLSQVRAAQGVQLHVHELVLSGYFEEQSKTHHCITNIIAGGCHGQRRQARYRAAHRR